MHPIERLWYRTSAAHLILTPLAALFGTVAILRRGLYRLGMLKRHRLPVPVVVIGNITVGGAGKTPLTIYLATALRELGFHPGIISRGYGGNASQAMEVTAQTAATTGGDEPVLIARRTACPVWIGRRRADAGKALLAAHPDVDVLLCDDGLQHYALCRDIEIAVVDAARGFGNGLLLPAGPLREPPRRLRSVDALVLNGPGSPAGLSAVPQYRMSLDPGTPYRVGQPAEQRDIAQFKDLRLAAMAGIAHPQRFFDQLRALGLNPDCQAFSDHHAFTPADFDRPDVDAVMVTEKDAVKYSGNIDAKIWALPVSATLSPDLAGFIAARLRTPNGLQAA